MVKGYYDNIISSTLISPEHSTPTQQSDMNDLHSFYVLHDGTTSGTSYSSPSSLSAATDCAGAAGDEGGIYTVLAFYKFFLLSEPMHQIKSRLEDFLRPRHVRGLILLAMEEGINGTISYPTIHDNAIQNFLETAICLEKRKEYHDNDDHYDDSSSRSLPSTTTTTMTKTNYVYYQKLRCCASHNNPTHVFHRLKIKIKKEIVSMTGGIPLRHIIPNFLINNNNKTRKAIENDSSTSAVTATAATTATVSENVTCISEHSSTAKFAERQLAADNNVADRNHSFSNTQESLDHSATAAPAPTEEDANPAGVVGIYVAPGSEWHTLLHDPHCWVIDMRNDYEVALGTFPNATNPGTKSFTEFPTWFQYELQRRRQEQHPQSNTFDKVAMFCTGGIRCEKASAYCLQQLRRKSSQTEQQHTSSSSLSLSSSLDIPVYHLEGGILAYLQQVPQKQSQWKGDCYVFDQRTAVTWGLRPSSTYGTCCYACRHPLSPQDIACKVYLPGISCPYCIFNPEKQKKRQQRYYERQIQIQLSIVRQTKHLHDSKEMKK